MNRTKFQADLKRGQTLEQEVENCITTYWSDSVSCTPLSVEAQKQHGGDFLIKGKSCANQFYIECKHDFRAESTGNLYLETKLQYRGNDTFSPGWTQKLLPSNQDVVVWKVKQDLYLSMTFQNIIDVCTSHDRYKTGSFTKYWPHSWGILFPYKNSSLIKQYSSLPLCLSTALQSSNLKINLKAC